ncbi:MAG: hypothetical protein RL482_917, partial [Actinomycetota bacterium]
ESNLSNGKAFVLVTAGPGLTNLVTALAGAYLESRELLVLGGQVKSSDLADKGLRQRGIQEVDGVAIARAVAKSVRRIERPIAKSEFFQLVNSGSTDRKGPVFLEVCLDAQGAPAGIVEGEVVAEISTDFQNGKIDEKSLEKLNDLLAKSDRPVILIGGGVSRNQLKSLMPEVDRLGVPKIAKPANHLISMCHSFAPDIESVCASTTRVNNAFDFLNFWILTPPP